MSQRTDPPLLSRRDYLRAAALATASLGATPLWSREARAGDPRPPPAITPPPPPDTPPLREGVGTAGDRAPALFIGHGGPDLFSRNKRGAQLAEMVTSLKTRPTAVIAMTPHRRTDVITLGGGAGGRALRSFPGRFAEQVGSFDYRTPSAAELSKRVLSLLQAARFETSRRGHRAYDHTVWGPLSHLFPDADVPVVQLGMPFVTDAEFFRIGQTLSPLADEGVLFLASGQLTHNLGQAFSEKTPSWASEFDAWVAETLERRDLDAAVDWRHRAPGESVAHPDDGGHFRVLMTALGFAVGSRGQLLSAQSPHFGFENGHFSKRGFVLF